ncbi:MAG TPA: hypothetical protein VMR21_04570 [Vicinamibacteria bacterium]|nr:hypothetical protein [Vicinamibacteria bacterium]
MAVTFGEGGQPVDEKSQTFHVRGRGGDADAQDVGLFYSVDLPIKRPGAYQFRVVVRDRASDRLGAASQFVDVPDVGKGALALSGIIVRAVEDGPGAPGAAETLVGRVRPGRTVEYVFQILNARRDPRHGKTSLTIQARLWREGERLYEGPPASLAVASADPRRIAAAGRLSLSPRLPAGNCVLEITVTDALAKRGVGGRRSGAGVMRRRQA